MPPAAYKLTFTNLKQTASCYASVYHSLLIQCVCGLQLHHCTSQPPYSADTSISPTNYRFFKKLNPPVGTPDTISKRDGRCYGIGSYGDMRYEPKGMLPTAVSFLAKIYDSRKERLPRWDAMNNVTLTCKTQLQ